MTESSYGQAGHGRALGLLWRVGRHFCLAWLALASVPALAQPPSDPDAPVFADRAIPAWPGVLPPQTAVALAIARHPEIRGAEAMIARRQADVALAEAERWPTIQYGLGPGYGKSYGGDGNATALRGNIGIEQPLWDFGATTGRITAAERLRAVADAGKADSAEKVAQDTLAAYADVLAGRERLAAARAAITAMRQVAERIGQRARAGLSDRSDVNAAGIAVRRARADAEQARTAADAALSRLIELVGVVPGDLASLPESYALLAAPDWSEPDFEAAPAVREARNALAAAQAKAEVADAERYPVLSLGASRSASTGAASANDSTWIGLTLRGSFSLGGAGRQRLLAARADHAAAEQELAARRLEARTGWLVASREESGARERLQELRDVADLWAATRDLYWQEYILDKRALSEVLNAEREIYAARAEQAAALRDAVAAAVKGRVAQGGLVALLQQPPAAASGDQTGLAARPAPRRVASAGIISALSAASLERLFPSEQGVAPTAAPLGAAAPYRLAARSANATADIRPRLTLSYELSAARGVD
ncbi:MAG: TolC family protein [Azonexus sp.]|nr:TolC family protein [Azonexus sp.]